MKSKQIQVFVSGRVQGVGFRYSTQQEARRLGIVGWVRNTEDDRVEIMAAGPEPRIEEFLAWCHQGPTGARVDQIDLVSDTPVDTLSFTRFEIHR